MARGNESRAGDLTGKRQAELNEQAAAEREVRAEQVAMATAAAAPKLQETIELQTNEVAPPVPTVKDVQTGVETPIVVGTDQARDEVRVVEVDRIDPALEKVKFRTNETLEQVTIGHGNNYDFVQGQEYQAERFIRDHLEEKGLIWH